MNFTGKLEGLKMDYATEKQSMTDFEVYCRRDYSTRSG